MELKPCPFIHLVKYGVEFTSDIYGRQCRIVCHDCGMIFQLSEDAGDKVRLVKLWNTRTPDPLLTAAMLNHLRDKSHRHEQRVFELEKCDHCDSPAEHHICDNCMNTEYPYVDADKLTEALDALRELVRFSELLEDEITDGDRDREAKALGMAKLIVLSIPEEVRDERSKRVRGANTRL